MTMSKGIILELMKPSSSLICILIALPLPSSELDVFNFRLGQNASITFTHTLTGGHVTSELFSLQEERPFYVNDQINPTALRPDQRHRFIVITQRTAENLTVTLLINDIREEDGDVYILAIRETKEGQSVNSILDAYVSVVLPPGKAECNITSSVVAPTWNEVHCQARISGGREGLLLCYQQSAKVPIFQPAVRAENHVTAVFWMNPDYPINCCSTESDEDADPQNCNNFIHVPHTFQPVTPRPLTTINMIKSHSASKNESYQSHIASTTEPISVDDEDKTNSNHTLHLGDASGSNRLSSIKLWYLCLLVMTIRFLDS